MLGERLGAGLALPRDGLGRRHPWGGRSLNTRHLALRHIHVVDIEERLVLGDGDEFFRRLHAADEARGFLRFHRAGQGRRGADVEAKLFRLPGFAQARRHRLQHSHAVHEVEFARDEDTNVFGELAAHRRSDQDALLVRALDHLGRGHRGRLGQDLEQADEEGVIDKLTLLVHHLFADLQFSNRQGVDQALALGVDAALVEGAGFEFVVHDAVVIGQQHRVGGAVADLQEHRLLGIQGLQRRQHHHRGAAAIDFAWRLLIAARRDREGAIATLLHHVLALNADIGRGEFHALRVDALGVALLVRDDVVQEVE